MPLFKKPTPRPVSGYVPVDLVQRLAGSGMSESQIITQLRSQGFSPAQIDAALRQALKAEVEAPETPTMEMPERAPSLARRPAPPEYREPPMPPEAPREYGAPPERLGMPPERIVMPRPPRPIELAPEEAPEYTFERPEEERFPIPEEAGEITLEEIIEGVVAERWGVFEERLSDFEKRDIQLQQQIEDIRRQIDEIAAKTKTAEQTLLGRFDDFGETITSVEGRIGSIERVFKDFLPTITENVKTMAEIVEKLKKK